MYSAFRMRALKPKKTGTRNGVAKGEADSTQRHGRSVSMERAGQVHHVERLSQPKGSERRGSGSKQRQLMQSASASNSMCSQKTATNKEGKSGKN